MRQHLARPPAVEPVQMAQAPPQRTAPAQPASAPAPRHDITGVRIDAAPPPALRPSSSAVLQLYRSQQVSADAVGAGTPLTFQSPAPEILAGPTRLAYRQTPTVSGSEFFRVAEDTTMAVPETTDEPKDFFATNAVLAASNAALARVGTALRLKKGGGQVRFDAITLPKIVPDRPDIPQQQGFASLWSDVCIDITNHITGNQGRSTEDVVLQSDDAGEASATIAVDGRGSAGTDRLAAHLSDPAPQPADPQQTIDAALGTIRRGNLQGPVGAAFGLASARGGLDGKAQRLGVNAFAQPEVGEGFATFSVFSSDEKASDYTTGRRRQRPNVWGYHHAAVVARSADHQDWVTLENYNRSPELNDRVYGILKEKYSRVAKRKWGEFKRAGRTGEQAAAEVRDYLVQEHEQASADYQRMFQDSAVSGSQLWFFRMYGSRRGQSFHEQQADSGAYVNPLTVRIRRNVVGQQLSKLNATERGVLGSIAAAQINWAPARRALDALHRQTTNAFATMKGRLNAIGERRTEAQSDAAIGQVEADYTAWLANAFTPRMDAALRAIKRGGLGGPAVTLADLQRQAAALEAPGYFAGAGDWLTDMNYFGTNASADRLTSLANLRAAIRDVPRRTL